MEPWGVWAEGEASKVEWVATAVRETVVSVDVFPFCVAEQQQMLEFRVNDHPIGTHTWKDCESWQGTLTIPETVLDIGWNKLTIHPTYALRPVDVTEGANPDTRALSVGFTRLLIGE